MSFQAAVYLLGGLALLLAMGVGAVGAGAAPMAQEHPTLTPTADAEAVVARASAVDLRAFPVVPQPTARTYAIFERGQALGRAPNALSKVGDCNSVAWIFLYPFGEGQYDLGEYAHLQATVDFFHDAFAQRSHAANNGLNVYSVLDPLWADAACESGETPLHCEYRLRNPSVAVIMFGTNDMLVLTPQQFDDGLRRVVEESARLGVIPVLSTFPRNLAYPQRSELFNQIVARVATDEDVPLINLWLALEPLPSHGVSTEDGFHLSGPVTRAGDFRSAENLRSGHPMRNLVTLQTLDVLRREVLQPRAAD